MRNILAKKPNFVFFKLVLKNSFYFDLDIIYKDLRISNILFKKMHKISLCKENTLFITIFVL